jgi:hypothetical protein
MRAGVARALQLAAAPCIRVNSSRLHSLMKRIESPVATTVPVGAKNLPSYERRVSVCAEPCSPAAKEASVSLMSPESRVPSDLALEGGRLSDPGQRTPQLRVPPCPPTVHVSAVPDAIRSI